MLSPLSGSLAPLGMARLRLATDWWPVAGQTCVAAYQPIGAASLAASYINLALPAGTYDAAPGVAPALGAGGWGYNGISGHLLTNCALAANYSIIIRLSTAGNGGSGFGRVIDTTTQALNIIPNATPGSTLRLAFSIGAETYNHGTPVTANAVIALAGRACYLAGAPIGTVPGATVPGGSAIIGNRAADDRTLNGTIAALAIYSTTLSAADVAALTLRIAAL
jgi:hypothetical protein